MNKKLINGLNEAMNAKAGYFLDNEDVKEVVEEIKPKTIDEKYLQIICPSCGVPMAYQFIEHRNEKNNYIIGIEYHNNKNKFVLMCRSGCRMEFETYNSMRKRN